MGKTAVDDAKRLHRKTNINYEKIFTDTGAVIQKLPSNLELGVFKHVFEGMNLVCDILNGYLKISNVTKYLIEEGVTKGTTEANVAYHLRRIKKTIGYNPALNVVYVPLLTKGTSTKYLMELQGKIQHYEKQGYGYKKNSDKSSIEFKVDPILGLHALIMELDSVSEIEEQISFKEYLELIKAKTSIYEKIYKLDNESRNKVDRLELVQKLDKIAQFTYVIHVDLQLMLERITPQLETLAGGNPMHTKLIEQIIYDIEKNINIKERYLEYTEKVNVDSIQLDAVTESDIIED